MTPHDLYLKKVDTLAKLKSLQQTEAALSFGAVLVCGLVTYTVFRIVPLDIILRLTVGTLTGAATIIVAFLFTRKRHRNIALARKKALKSYSDDLSAWLRTKIPGDFEIMGDIMDSSVSIRSRGKKVGYYTLSAKNEKMELQ